MSRTAAFAIALLTAAAIAMVFTLSGKPQGQSESLAPYPKGPSATAPASLPEEHGPHGKITEFQRVTSEALAKMPRLADFRDRTSEEVHSTPQELTDMSPVLAQIGDSLRAHSELIPQGIAFYENCARNPQVATALRSVCLRDLKYWATLQPDISEVRESDYPADIWQVAASLPPVIP